MSEGEVVANAPPPAQLVPLKVSPRVKKYVVRRKVEEEKPREPKKVMVARRIADGETIELENKKIEMPRSNSLSRARVEMLPQSLATSSDEYFTGPPVGESGKPLEWGLLGDVDDFLEYEFKKTGKAFSPPAKSPTSAEQVEQLSPRSQARLAEARLERKKLAAMMPEDRIVATSNQRAIKRWEEANAEWDSFKKRMMKKLNTNAGSLLISTTDEYRLKTETYDLIDQAVPIWNKYGPVHWQMTLRNETSHFVPLGNEFTGLYCKVGEPVNRKNESIRRASTQTSHEQTRSNTWRDSHFLHTRIKQLSKRMSAIQPNFTGQLAALERPVKEDNPLGDLKIVGTDLFADDDEGADNLESTLGDPMDITLTLPPPELIPATPGLQDLESSRDETVFPNGVVVMGPRTEVVTERVLLTCRLGERASVQAEFVNMGSTSLQFEWRVRPKSEEEPSTEDVGSFMWGALKGSLEPGQRVQIPFLFVPTKPGVFLETLELITVPALPEDSTPLLFLKGVCELPDDNSVVRRTLEEELQKSGEKESKGALEEIVPTHVPEKEPDEHFHRFLFFTRNGHRLHYYRENCQAFLQLAAETFACHKRAVRAKAQWDFSADTLLDWIKRIPIRNSHKIEEFTKRWEELVAQASIRPEPDATRYDIMSWLLCGVVAQIPRISRGIREELDIVEPLPHVAVQMEEERKRLAEEELIRTDPKARRAAAKKAKQQPPKLSPEEAEKKAAEEAEAAAARAEERKVEVKLEEERAVKEADYSGKLQAQLKELLTVAVAEFDGLTVAIDDLPSANTEQENAANAAKMTAQAKMTAKMAALRARPVFSVAAWGNGIAFPDLGEKKPDPKDKKKKPKKPKKGEVIVLPPKSPLEEKDVVLAAASGTHAVGYTSDHFYYLIKNPDPSAQAGGKGKKGERPKTASPDETDDLPKSISRLQGYKAVALACGANVTVLAAEVNGLYVYDHDAESVTHHMEGTTVVDVSVSPDGVNFFAVTEAGELWSMGENTKVGMLGHNDKNKVEAFKIVEALEGVKVVSVSAGLQHVVCLAADGNVYACGEAYGCGVGDKKPKAVPEVVPSLSAQALSGSEEEVGEDAERVVQLTSGSNVSLALTSAGRVFSWGKGGDGSLGLGDNKDREVPEEVAGLAGKGVTRLSAGEAHCVAFCEDSTIFTWGKGTSGCLGHGNTESQLAPTAMDMVQEYMAVPTGVVAGGNFSLGFLKKLS